MASCWTGKLGRGAVLALSSLVFSQDAPPKRQPEPTADAQKQSEKVIRDLFREEYAKRSLADQQAFARKLLQQGIDTQDDPPARYVLLREAREIAARCGDTKTALAAADETARRYEIDGLDLKAKILTTAATLVKSPDAASALADACLEVTDAAIREDKFDVARGLAQKAETAAKAAKDAVKTAQAQKRGREIEELQREAKKAKIAAEVLGLNPADPEASTALGRYLLMKGDLEKALPLLAKGSDPVLRSAAEKELAVALDPGKALGAADAWWEAGEKEKTEILKNALLGRAKENYEKAVPGLTGIAKTRAEKRIADLENMASPSRGGRAWINLIPLIDPQRDAVKGTWEIKNGKLFSDNTKCARLEIPCEVPEEYDFQIKFTRLEGNDCVIQILSHSGKQFNWGVGYWENKYFSFDMVAGQRTGSNPTSVPKSITNNQAYTSLVAVRRDSVSAYIDGVLVVQHKTNYEDLDLFNAWKLRSSARIGLATQVSPTQFDEVQLREVSGKFKRLR